MSQVTITIDRFFELKQLMKKTLGKRISEAMRNKSRTRIRYLTPFYEREKISRLARRDMMKADPRFAELFAWIFDLEKRLKEAGLVKNQHDFARMCGTTYDSIKHWRNYNGNSGGRFPSDRAFKNLARLETMLQAKIEITHSKTNVKSKKFPKSRIKIPGRKQISVQNQYN